MAEKILQTRIISKHVTFQQATTGTWAPYEGEIVLARVDTQQPDGHGGIKVVPTFLMKVGAKDSEGNLYAIKDLKWTHAPASDVYSWAKQQKLAITDEGTGNVITGILATDEGVTITRASVATSDALAQANAAIEALQAADTAIRGEFAAADTALDNKITAINTSLAEDGTVGAKIKQAQTDATSGIAKAEAAQKTIDDYKPVIEAAVALKADASTVADMDAAYKAEDAAIRSEFAAADTSLHTTITGEIAAAEGRAAADATTKASNAETAAKTAASEALAAAKTELQGNIDTLSGVVTGIDSAYKAADETLGNRVGTLEAKVQNVSTVMDFVGVATVEVSEDGDISVTVDGVESFQKGDVVVDNSGKEYVFDGSTWHEFGSTSATDSALMELAQEVANFKSEVASTYATAANLTTETTQRTEADAAIRSEFANADSALKSELTSDITTAKSEAIAEATRLDGVQYTTITGEYTQAIADSAAAIKSAYEAADATALASAKEFATSEVAALSATVSALDTAYKAADTQLTNSIAAITADYLKAADKTELANATAAVASDLANLTTTVTNNKADVDTNFVKVVNNQFTLNGDVIIFDCGTTEEN